MSINDTPVIHASAYVHPTAVIIGNVRIGKNVFVGPGAVLRADEPNSCITIGENSNIQDRVIVHCLGDNTVSVGKNTSLSHGCIVHGPVKIGSWCFVGFNSVVFNAVLADHVVVKHATIVEKKSIAKNRIIGNEIKLIEKPLCDDHREFCRKVVAMNQYLRPRYKKLKNR